MNTRTLNPQAAPSIHPHRVLAKIERLLGLRYLPHQWSDLLRLLKPASQELGITGVDRCLGWLEHDGQSEEQVRILAKHLTIGESYFFREIVVVSLLRDVIIPEILRRKSETGDGLFRIWSAGCSTGEEVYTMGIIIASLLREDSSMKVQILGTDINPSAIERAERGIYRDWSFRDMNTDLIDAWFIPQEDNRYSVSDRLRSMVEFRQLNLVDVQSYPSAMDIIMCRNVLMYFTRPVVNDIVEGFRHSLRPDGWLVPSMTETTLINVPGLEGVRFGDMTLFRHQQAEVPVAASKGSEDSVPLDTPPMLDREQGYRSSFEEILPGKIFGKASSAGIVDQSSAHEYHLSLPSLPSVVDQHSFEELIDSLPEEGVKVPAVSSGYDPAQEAADNAKALADAGKLDEALEAAEQAVADHKMSPYCHFILGTILRELGETQRALQSFDRALYLDPVFIPAHFGIGALYRFLGKRDKAARHLGNALELIEAVPDQDAMMVWSDMTARNLAAIIRAMDGGEL